MTNRRWDCKQYDLDHPEVSEYTSQDGPWVLVVYEQPYGEGWGWVVEGVSWGAMKRGAVASRAAAEAKVEEALEQLKAVANG